MRCEKSQGWNSCCKVCFVATMDQLQGSLEVMENGRVILDDVVRNVVEGEVDTGGEVTAVTAPASSNTTMSCAKPDSNEIHPNLSSPSSNMPETVGLVSVETSLEIITSTSLRTPKGKGRLKKETTVKKSKPAKDASAFRVKGLTDYLTDFFTPKHEKRHRSQPPVSRLPAKKTQKSVTAQPKKSAKAPLRRVASSNLSTPQQEESEPVQIMKAPLKTRLRSRSAPHSPSENLHPTPVRGPITRKSALRTTKIPPEKKESIPKSKEESVDEFLGMILEPTAEEVEMFVEARRRSSVIALQPSVTSQPSLADEMSFKSSVRRKSRKKVKIQPNPSKFLQLGDKKYLTLFASLAGFIRGDCIFMCEFCLRQFESSANLAEHYESCAWHSPPGSILYRDTVDRSFPAIRAGGKPSLKQELLVYEIDGNAWVIYCQRLASLGKLFIQTKTLLYDVEHFCFYVLCYRNELGDHLIGYFSKDKFGFPNCFNLNCIVVFPPYQGGGYGKFLVEFSFLLSRINLQPGSPEKPLSDDGRRTYLSAWSRALLEALLRRKNEMAALTELNDLSKETGMYAQDVAGVLIELKILKPVEDIVSEETLEERKQGKVKTHPTSWYVDMNAPRLTEFAKAVHEGTLPTKIVLDERNFLHAPKKQITEPDG